MPAPVEASTPSYISSQSADVILSDVRPFKLKAEALHAINVLLDEFLYNILNAAGSLSTDKLRTSLLSLLPTSLGKEALLEAEVELRAYWDRTNVEGGVLSMPEDDSNTFHLQWSFELLRLKCEAYSTLNESDEDPTVEDRIQTRFNQAVTVPPSGALLAPAALYLTAILEATCEHVLTNVGRVAARDSSRVSATVNDLFTALCEDDSIYGLFRSMRVYEQIELLSKSPAKSRRSKSFSRHDLGSSTTSPHTGSPHQDLSSGKDSASISRSRLSSEVSSTTTAAMLGATTSGSRTSLEKARAMKMFAANSKSSMEGDSQNGHHKKSESGISEKHHLREESQRLLYEDTVLQQEFDDLMRSSSTMKVSLTPDRLKTMEVYKQERASRRPVAPLSYKADSDSLSSSKRPSLRHVDSIVEDEEELAFPQPPTASLPRLRQPTSAAPVSAVPPAANRTRSISASSIGLRGKPSRNIPRKQPPSVTTSVDRMTRPTAEQPNGFPPRTRKRQHNRESLDLDDVMAGSDTEPQLTPPAPSRTPTTSSKKNTPGGVSAATRELMDFLAQGPPGEPSRPGADFAAFDGPTLHHNPSSPSLDAKPKGDRLRRIISKISLSNGEKSKNGPSYVPARTPATPKQPPIPVAVHPTPPRPHTLAAHHSPTGLASLANRPIPPRLHRPPSPPPSPEQISPPPSPVKVVGPTNVPHSPTQSARSSNRPPSPALVPPRKDSRDRTPSRQTNVNGSAHTSLNGSVNGSAVTHIPGQTQYIADTAASKPAPIEPSKRTTNETDINPSRPSLQNRRAHPSVVTNPPIPSDPPIGLSSVEVRDLHRLISRATNADECRVIMDMFVARFTASHESHDVAVSYPSPSTSIAGHGQLTSSEDSALEQSLVELFLGGESSLEGIPRVTADEPLPPTNVSGTSINPPAPILTPSTDNNNSTLVGETKA